MAMINLAGTPAIRPSIAALKALQLKSSLTMGVKSLEHVKQAHARLFRLGLFDDELNRNLLNALLGNYFQFNNPHFAKLTFHHINLPNIFLFNTMIRGLVSCGLLEDSLEYYHMLRFKGLFPNNFTCPFVLKACARVLDINLGLKIHNIIIKLGFDTDVYVNRNLVSMYSKFGCLYDAHKVFDEMPERNSFSCTAIIVGYLNNGRFDEAMSLFKGFLEEGLKPDGVILVKFLCACAEFGELELGEWVHRFAHLNGFRNDLVLNTSLINMYVKCGAMDKAYGVFDQMLERDVVSYSVMIQGCVANGLAVEAITLFLEMERENVKPDCAAIVSFLCACTSLGAVDMGERVINSMKRDELVAEPILGTTVIDMYAKCGNIDLAWNFFKEMNEKDLAVWNAIISGLSVKGHFKAVFGLFAQMQKLGLQPNGSTFIGLLRGCTRAGLVDEAWKYFYSMERVFSVTPSIEHYGCMVNLLSRAGLLQEAYYFIQSMPMKPSVFVWEALLGGCRLHKNTHLAEYVSQQLVQLEPWNSRNYLHCKQYMA